MNPLNRPVGLVHDWLTGQRGGENVLAAIAELFPAAPIYTLFHFPGSVDARIEAHPIVTSFLQRAPGLDPAYRWYLPLFPAGAADLPVAGHRLVISSSHCVAKSVRRGPNAWHICYCHTPMRYAWDQQEAYFGTGRGPLSRLQRAILAALRRWDVVTANRVDRYLANSKFVADRIRSYYGRSADVLAPPVDTGFFRPSEQNPPPRLHALVVAALAPYKKVDRAIHACARAGLPLVIVGDGPERARLSAMAGPTVRFVSRIGRDELRELYRQALLFLQPGVEDFGIAAVEALACGVPVVARGQGGILDIARDGVEGVLYQADEPEALAAAIDKCRQIQFNSLNLRERAGQFSAERFARSFEEIVLLDWPKTEVDRS